MSHIDAQDEAVHWLTQLESALTSRRPRAVLDLFATECFWRDLVAFTWTIVTLEGQAQIGAMLSSCRAAGQTTAMQIDGPAIVDQGIVEAWFTFETPTGRGRGHMRLRAGRCWTLLTTLQELKGFEEPHGVTRLRGAAQGVGPGRRSWLEEQVQRRADLGTLEQPYCLIIGGGQGGIALAARLKRLNVPALVVDTRARPGDSWRARYKSLCLHDPVWYDHLPYLPFPDHWPVFTPKDKMGDWLEMYTKVMEIDYWGNTTCHGARYDETVGEWRVQLTRDGNELTLRPRQLVLATGLSGLPEIPEFPGAAEFAGCQMHSSEFSDGAAWRGKRCVVVGSNNSAHDICANLWENGAQVTMLQRSSTLVVRSDTLMQVGWGKLYSEAALAAGITTERADLTLASLPFKVMAQLQKPVYDRVQRMDGGFYDRLRRAGFMLDFGEDGTGLSLKYLRRGSGYYIDVGASELISNGSVRLRSPVSVASLEVGSVQLTDGSSEPADLVVYATGFGSMVGWAAKLVSQEVADRIGSCWGLGSGTSKDPGPWEGELRNMWKPTAQPGLWFHGGNLQQSRSYSLYLALQLKARLEGLDTPVFQLTR